MGYSPVLNRLFRKASLIYDAQFTIYLRPVTDRRCPFFRRLKGGKIQCFQQGCIAWENASLLVQLTVSRIQGFNGICRIYHLSSYPSSVSWNSDISVSIFQSLCPTQPGSFFIHSLVNGFQICGKCYSVFIRNVF